MAYEPWQPGMILTQARLASISPTWRDWTPVWTTSTGNNTPSFGNASVVARYAQSALTVFWRLEITFGTTTNFGGGTASDNWRLSAPVPAADLASVVGQGEVQRTTAPSGYTNSAGTRMGIRVRLATASAFDIEGSTGNVNAVSTASTSGLIDAVSPWVWESGSWLRAWGQYEAAA